MKKQHGLTLVEMMISVVIGLFLLATTLNVYVGTVRGSSGTIKGARLNHDLEMAINLMGNDIRRAGYWGTTPGGTNGANVAADPKSNPFTKEDTATPLNTKNIQIIGNTCILYTYDANNDGDVDLDEHFGFKLENNTVKMKLGATANTVAGGASTTDCSGGSWQEFIDSNTITVTKLRFSFLSLDSSNDSSPCSSLTAATCLTGTTRCWNLTTKAEPDSNNTTDCAGITVTPAINSADASTYHALGIRRVVNVVIKAQLKDDTTVSKTLVSTIEVRNNRLFLKTS